MHSRAIGLLGLVVLSMVVFAAVFAPLVTPYDPEIGDLQSRLLPPLSGGHILGTDQQGRDLWTRVIFGARISALIASAALIGSASLGTLIGLCAGYFGGALDRFVSVAINLQLSFPFIVLALTIAAIVGASVQNLVLTLVIASWVAYARLMRGAVLQIGQDEFVTAARGIGASHPRILFRHLLPNTLNNLIVLASLELSRLIIAEASISFLGFGVRPPMPAWGAMLADSRSYITTAWWLAAFPGLALAVTALGANLVGDWLRDLSDPRLGRSVTP